MTYACYSLLSESPPGFREGAPTRHEILAAPLAILAPNVEQALAALHPLRERAEALLLNPADEFAYETVSPRLHVLNVKPAMLPDLHALAQSYLSLMADGSRINAHCRKLEAELAIRRGEATRVRTSYDQNLSRLSRLVEELRDQKERLSATLLSIGDGVMACDAEGCIVTLNSVAERLTGWSTVEAQGRPIEEVFRIVNVHTRAIAENPVDRSLREGVIVGLANHTTLIARDGAEYQIADSCAPIRHANGEVFGAVLVFRDVSEEYARRERIRQSEYEKALIMDSVTEGIAFHGRDRRIIWANRAYLQGVATITGKPATVETIKGKRCYELWGLTKFCDECPVASALRTGRPRESEMTPQNQAHWPATQGSYLVRSAPVKDPGGHIVGAIEVMIDITEQKRNETLHQRFQMLERLGLLAGGIAHDFNNLLMGVFGNIEIATLQLSEDHAAHAALRDAHQALDRTRRLTSRLLTFAKGGSPVLETVDLRRELSDTVRFNLAGSNVAAAFEIPADLWTVHADKGQLGEVIANLTINAKEAMPAGGTLYVRAENIAVMHGNPSPPLKGDAIKLTFTDDGVGIPSRLLDRIFDPYFSTKQTGSGLGLSVVHSIITRHKGHVEVESSQDRGTTFTVFLPADGKAQPSTTVDHPPASATGSRANGRILLMDDEEVVRTTTSRMLQSLGYTVETAVNGRDAIDKYRNAMTRGEPFGMTIMDLTIPGGMGGKETMAKLRRIDPSTKAIVYSGYASDPVVADYKDYGFSGCLVKPLTLMELKREICRATEASETDHLGTDGAW